MISTSFITGTGFMKCMPITDSGRFVRAAISVIEIELVLVARIAPGVGERVEVGEDLELELAVLGRGLDDERRARRPRRVDVRGRRCGRGSRPSLGRLSVPFLIWRSRFFAIVVAPARERVASATSIIVTGNPDCANTCAIPLPICPAPIPRCARPSCS